MSDAAAPARRAAGSTVWGLFAQRAAEHPRRIAVEHDGGTLDYAALHAQALRLAALLAAQGVGRGDAVAVVSENRAEVLLLFLAAARLGAVVACPNPRLAAPEVGAALDLVQPRTVWVSPRHEALVAAAPRAGADAPAHVTGAGGDPPAQVFGAVLDAMLRGSGEEPPAPEVDPEDALLILYTSGTTGQAKGAVLSHRAEVARNLVIRAELGIAPEDTFVAWSPLCHMGAAECSLGTLMAGGTVIVVDGFDRERLARIVATRRLGWLLLMPGMVAGFVQTLRERGVRPAGVKVCGVMADLVPPADIAAVTALLGAPYANTFGSTETGCPPCSSSLLAPGRAPPHLRKRQSPSCEVRLVGPDGRDVPPGTPGELWMRGPTLFSGYHRNAVATAEAFAGGWYHMGDVFVRHADGTLDFVDRVKYLIKSGGENIYPAEIERVLLAHPGVADAAVVRRADPRWGEVPVAFVARRDAGAEAAGPAGAVSADALRDWCRGRLAAYKLPREVVFLAAGDFPRNGTGKVLRHELERRLPGASGGPPPAPPGG